MKITGTVSIARMSLTASSPELPAASKELASVAVPQSDATVATPDVAAPQPIASIEPAPTDAAPIETAPAVVAETAQADVIPTLDARPIATLSLDRKPVLALDLPSGLDADTGEPQGMAIRAAITATFVARKAGFDAPGASAYTGEVHVVPIGVRPPANL